MNPILRSFLTLVAFLASVVFVQLFLLLWLPDSLALVATLLAWPSAWWVAWRVWFGLVDPERGLGVSVGILQLVRICSSMRPPTTHLDT